jgi:hypothetical protein
MTTVMQLLDTVNAELAGQADPAYRELVRTRYNMNVDNFLGVRTPVIHRIAGKYYQLLKARHIDERLEFSICCSSQVYWCS